MSKADPPSAASFSSASAPAPLPTPWAAIARQGVINARLEAKRKAAVRPASTAHRHAIESILAFLELSELAKASHVSRHWHNAVLHMRPLGSGVLLGTALEQCDRKSQLFRHVTSVSSWFAPSPPTDLLRLFAAMPQLRSVSWDLSMPCKPFAWPAALTEIDLRMEAESKAALLLDDVHLLLKSISTSARALKRFSVHTRLQTMRGLNFSFLLDLPELVFLYLEFQRRRGGALWRLGDSQVHTLRQLTHLTDLVFAFVEPSASFVCCVRPISCHSLMCDVSIPSMTRLPYALDHCQPWWD